MEIASLLLAADDQLEITVVELFDRPLPVMLDKDMADKVTDYLTKKASICSLGKKWKSLSVSGVR
jgi:NADH oxidase (H2O2-forming)